MTPVYQTIVDKELGDCIRAVIATLLDKSIINVPHFLEFKDNWYEELEEYLAKEGYKAGCNLYNKNYIRLLHPIDSCFEKEKFYKPAMLNKTNLKKEESINGYYFASVLSPGYFNYKDGINSHTHAVVIDSNFNIVHDPNPRYKGILEYPLANLLKYNGITLVWIIKKIK